MSRYKEPIKLQAPHWDNDEAAWVKASHSFLASQRIAFHFTQFQQADPKTDAEFAAQLGHMSAVLVDLIDHWTLRKPGTPYEQGVERPVWELTADAIEAQPAEDILYLFREGMAAYGASVAPPEDAITPAAAAEGLTPANFPDPDPARGDLPRG